MNAKLLALLAAALLPATSAIPSAAIAGTDPSDLPGSAPAWLIIGLYEGTIPTSALGGLGYGDFDWAGMTPAQRTALYTNAVQEAEQNW